MQMMLVEDDALHRKFLRSAVNSALPECSYIREAENGAAALRLAENSMFDSVILDLQMPELNGVETAKSLWRRNPKTKVLFWSNYSEEAYVRGISRIVPSGAVYGYILKSATEDLLQLAIKGVFVAEQCVIDRAVREVQNATGHQAATLTNAEHEVLLDLCVGLTDKAIAHRRGLSLRGVQARLQALYAKLGLERGDRQSSSWGEVYNLRTRAISVALIRGILTPDLLSTEEVQLEKWIASDVSKSIP